MSDVSHNLHLQQPGQEGEAKVLLHAGTLLLNVEKCPHLCISYSDARVGVIVLPSAAVQVPRRSIRRAGDLFFKTGFETNL